jgi:acetyltransferase-like isoleucine patch superfamily enzyme
VIQDHVVLGKLPALSPRSTARGEVGPLQLAAGVTVCTGAIVFAGTRIGERVILGDGCFVRERCTVGPGTVIGRACSVDNDVQIGARVKVQTNAYLTARTVVEDDVFVAPGVITTNDNTMSRHAPGDAPYGSVLRRACRIGAGAVILPGIEIGEEAFVAAASIVTRAVAARTLVMGRPARVVRQVIDAELIEHWRRRPSNARPLKTLVTRRS